MTPSLSPRRVSPLSSSDRGAVARSLNAGGAAPSNPDLRARTCRATGDLAAKDVPQYEANRALIVATCSTDLD